MTNDHWASDRILPGLVPRESEIDRSAAKPPPDLHQSSLRPSTVSTVDSPVGGLFEWEGTTRLHHISA
jgi:hypothetical protein